MGTILTTIKNAIQASHQALHQAHERICGISFKGEEALSETLISRFEFNFDDMQAPWTYDYEHARRCTRCEGTPGARARQVRGHASNN